MKRRTQQSTGSLPAMQVTCDGGHSYWKLLANGITCEIMPHALQPLSDADWEHVNWIDAQNPDYVMVNNKPYVVGRMAERHGINVVKTGAARYERGYYGVLMAAVLYRMFDSPVGPITLFASHPPSDKQYRGELAKSAKGQWLVQCGDDVREFNIETVYTYDEPVGGLMNVAIDDYGNENQEFTDGDILVIDSGGGTTSVVGCAPGGQVDYGMSESFNIGILSVMDTFDKLFRQRYHEEFRHTRKLDMDRMRDALQMGVYRGGGFEFPCEYESAQAKSLLLNRLAEIVQTRAGSTLRYDKIILTGGGCGLLESELRAMLRHGDIHLADKPAEIHLANVRGGRKMYLALREAGVVE